MTRPFLLLVVRSIDQLSRAGALQMKQEMISHTMEFALIAAIERSSAIVCHLHHRDWNYCPGVLFPAQSLSWDSLFEVWGSARVQRNMSLTRLSDCDCQLLCAARCAISAADFSSQTTTCFEKYNCAKLCCLLQANLINLYLGLWTTSLSLLERNF